MVQIEVYVLDYKCFMKKKYYSWCVRDVK